MDKHQARNALLGINLGFGIVFVLFPKFAMRLYGIDPEEHEVAAYPVRYFGARSLVLAVLLMDEDASEALLEQWALITGFDGAVNVLALISGEVPKRTALLGALTSGVAGAMGYMARD